MAATGGLIATDIGMGIGAAIGLATGTGTEVSSEKKIIVIFQYFTWAKF